MYFFRSGLKGLFVAGAIALVSNGCSSSPSSSGAADAATDSSGIVIHRSDAAPPGSDDGGGDAGPPDMTTGKPCATDADCSTTGKNVCSINVVGQVTNLSVQLWPTPICLLAIPASGSNCDPGTDGNLHYCDGPDLSTSPGVCVAIQGGGLCLPKCTLALNGTPAVGCAGKDACNITDFILTRATGVVKAYGYCQGSCQADADCSALGADWLCQQDIGYCVQTMKGVRTKPFGAACSTTPLTGDSATGACHCFGNATAGYCTSSCVVGGSPCPAGYVCEAGLPTTLTFATAGTRPGATVQNPGLAGICVPSCTLADAGVSEAAAPAEAGATEGGLAGDGGGVAMDAAGTPADASPSPLVAATCPVGLVCTTGTVVGPECL